MIHAVIFDMGGTLLDFNPRHLPWLTWERPGLEAAHAFLVGRGHNVPFETFVEHLAGELPGRWERATQGGENLRVGDMLRESCEVCGAAPTPGEVEEATARYVAPLDAEVVVYPDAGKTLRTLRRRGYKIGLISNTMWPGRFHLIQLERFGLLSLLDHTLFSADVGIWKPQPGIYELALDALGARASEAVYVGDTPEHDVVGAQRAGLRGVYRRNNRSLPDDVTPDAEISRLAELPSLIERW